MSATLRQDLRLAAFAACSGFSIRDNAGMAAPEFVDGIPTDSLSFVLGAWHVWLTDRGWRAARLVDGRYEPPVPSQFFSSLLKALRHVLAAEGQAN